MNKQGTAIFFILMMGVAFFILGLALANPLKEVMDEARTSDQLNCTNSTVTEQNKAICTSIDIQQFLFTGVIFGLAGILIGGILYR